MLKYWLQVAGAVGTMSLEKKPGMSDSAHNEKVFTKDAEEGAMEVSEKQAVPEYVGKGEFTM